MPDYINDPDLLAQLEGRPARNVLTAALAAEGVSGKVADIARSIYQQESGSGRNTRTSNAGAVGGMQVIPATFAGVADKGWDINDPVQNARAGVRYVKQLFEQAGGDAALTAAGYYGGPGGLEKARRGVAVSDPRNPGAPTTLQYGQQVAARIPKERGIVQRAVESVIPSAQAAERQYIQDPELLKQLDAGDVPRIEVRGTSADEPRGFVGSAIDATRNLGVGAVRGAAGIGSTLLAPTDYLADRLGGVPGGTANAARRASIDAFVADNADPSSINFHAGKLGTEIAGTAGVGGMLAAPVRAAAPLIGRGAPAINALAESLASGGMRTGLAPVGFVQGAGNMLARVAGGAGTGAVSAGLVDPGSVSTGGAIGAVSPLVISGFGRGGQAIGAAYRNLRAPQVQMAEKLAKATGEPLEKVIAALSQQGPQLIEGYRPTAPQLLQSPLISQLQRTLKTAGNDALGSAERAQQAAYRGALERVAPVAFSVNDAATRAGTAIQDYAIPARAEASKQVSRAFESVDPFGETGLLLPLEGMEAAKAKFLGPGTFGTGSKAEQALGTARSIGQETIDAVTPARAATARNSEQTLAQAVRRAGGINAGTTSGRAFAGELKDLRQSGGGSLVFNSRGQSLDKLAESMHARGFIDDADPATLLNALRNPDTARSTGMAGDADRAYRALLEAAQGDAPGAITIAKPVPFQTMQNLRSSIGEAAQMAEAKGANKEAAALKTMVGEIDARINAAAAGDATAGYFPKDVADQYRKALSMHAAKMRQFETGPQVGMFRRGGDGQAAVQGGEIPGKFYSGRASQVDDVRSLKRLLGDRADLMQEMKRFAVTEGAATGNVAGDLTSKYTKWLLARSGANRELFTEGERATLHEVGKAVQRSINAENLGRVSNSDTAQKLASLQSNGLIDSKAMNLLAARIPVVRSFTGPILNALRESASRDRANQMASLLANPEDFAAALRRGAGGTPENNAVTNSLRLALPLTYRVAPLLGAQ